MLAKLDKSMRDDWVLSGMSWEKSMYMVREF